MLYYDEINAAAAEQRMHLHSLIRNAMGAGKGDYVKLQRSLAEAAGLQADD